MANCNDKIQQVVLDETTEAIVVRGGISVQFNAIGGIEVYGNSPVTLHAFANEAAKQVGDRMKDGTIFAGISPHTNKPMYAMPADASLRMKWKKAMKYAAEFEGGGHSKGTFRVPTDGELNVLFQNLAKIGGFNETGSNPAGWYWSCTENDAVHATGQSFRGGYQYWDLKNRRYSVRLVCS